MGHPGATQGVCPVVSDVDEIPVGFEGAAEPEGEIVVVLDDQDAR
jgi:hypothetical protein